MDERRTRVTGSRWVKGPRYTIKLEGSGKVGERAKMIVGIRDPNTIARVDEAIAWSRKKVRERFPGEEYEVHYHVYGKNGVMGDLEPLKQTTAHELGIVIEVLGETQEEANTVCSLTRSTLLHYGYPGRVATAGNLAFPFSPSDVQAGTVFEFALYHLMPIDPATTFPFHMEEVKLGTVSKENAA